MKRVFRAGRTLVGVLALIVIGCDGPSGARSGNRAPDIAGEDANGRPIRLSQYKGKVVLVDFWATWCGPCVREIPRGTELVRKFSGRPFAILGVSSDQTRDDLRQFTERTNLPWENIFDGSGKISDQFGVRGLPTFVLVDADGIIRGRWTGGGQSSQIETEVAKWVEEAEKNRR